MPKMTLLEMTQNILSAMDSDEVNSISDTVESLQVARVVVETYDELYANMVSASFKGLIKLDSLADPERPTTLAIPANVKSIDWVRYEAVDVPYKSVEQFLLDSFQITSEQVTMDPVSGSYFKIYTDRNPTCFTTFNNEWLVFDGFNSDTDSVLQQSKTTCWGQYSPSWDFSDDAYAPFLPASDYPGLLAEAKSSCFINLKQLSNSKEEQRSRRQRVRRMNDEWRANQRKPYDSVVDFGRKGHGR